jgi:hypothetical protein
MLKEEAFDLKIDALLFHAHQEGFVFFDCHIV